MYRLFVIYTTTPHLLFSYLQPDRTMWDSEDPVLDYLNCFLLNWVDLQH